MFNSGLSANGKKLPVMTTDTAGPYNGQFANNVLNFAMIKCERNQSNSNTFFSSLLTFRQWRLKN